MAIGLLLVDKELIPELFLLPKGFNIVAINETENGRYFEFVFDSDLIPESAKYQDHPEIQPVLLNRLSEMGDRVVELSRLTVYGEFKKGEGKEIRVLFEKPVEEVRGK